MGVSRRDSMLQAPGSTPAAVRSAVIPLNKPSENFLGVRDRLLADSLLQFIRFMRIEIAVIAVGVDP